MKLPRFRTDAADRRGPSGCLLVILVFLMVFVAVFSGVGVCVVWTEHARITSFRPAEAEVLSKQVQRREFEEEESGEPRHAYWPIVEYRYHADGKAFTSRNVFSSDEGGSQPWAEGVADGFEVGQAVWAYYDPARPAEAFLLPHPSFAFLFILFPMPMACIGYKLLVRNDQRLSRVEMTVMAMIWNLVGLAVFGDYFLTAGWAYSYAALRVALVYGAVGVIMATWAFPESGMAERLRGAVGSALVGAVLGLVCGLLAYKIMRFIQGGQVDWTTWAVCGAKIGAWVLGLVGGSLALFKPRRRPEDQANP